MTNYVPRHSKKRERFERVESELMRAISSGAQPAVLERLVFDVRQAKLRALRARKAQLPPKGEFADEIAAIDRSIEAWLHRGSDEILDQYRRISGGN